MRSLFVVGILETLICLANVYFIAEPTVQTVTQGAKMKTHTLGQLF